MINDPTLLKVLYKCLENWIIVEDDETANQIINNKNLARNISGCVTLDGTKHTLGSIIIGNNNNAITNTDTNNNNNNNKSHQNNPNMLQLEHQIKYEKIKKQYKNFVNNLYNLEILINNRKRKNSNILQLTDIHHNISINENEISSIKNSLLLQKEKSELAHR